MDETIIQLTSPLDGKVCNDCHQLLPLPCFTPRGNGFRGSCRQCTNARQNAHRRALLEAHPDEVRESYRQYRKAHAASAKEHHRRYYERHTEAAKARAKHYYAGHTEHLAECSRRYAETHRDHTRAWWHRHMAKKRGIAGQFTVQEWQDLKARYNYRCLCCDKSEPEIKLTVDHVIPLKDGGSNSIENIQPLCKSCNCSKREKHIDYR